MCLGEAQERLFSCFSLASDDLTDKLKLLSHLLIGCDDFIEGIHNFALNTDVIARIRTEKSPPRINCSALRSFCR